jgi:hypothetical protein
MLDAAHFLLCGSIVLTNSSGRQEPRPRAHVGCVRGIEMNDLHQRNKPMKRTTLAVIATMLMLGGSTLAQSGGSPGGTAGGSAGGSGSAGMSSSPSANPSAGGTMQTNPTANPGRVGANGRPCGTSASGTGSSNLKPTTSGSGITTYSSGSSNSSAGC